METQFTWIAFYKELAQKLLPYKRNRKPLVDFIQSGDNRFKNDVGKSLVEYLHMEDGSPISDIDPFSVFAIFNRGRITYKNRQNICSAFKEHFAIKATVPSDFDGIPIVDARRSFFFTWDVKRNPYIIADMWELFERVVNDDEIEEWYNKVISNKFPKNSLTMVLYWLNPMKYMALDSRSRTFLQTFGITHFNIGNYKEYAIILNEIKEKMKSKQIPYSTYVEISHAAWLSSNTNPSNTMQGDMNTNDSPIIALLHANKNLILTGAPGTGKTFLANELAHELGADDKSICKVQFHPSYDYTDFVEGIRPMEDGTFKRADGEFKAFCKRALLAQNTATDILSELNDDPKVWKVSLAGTGDNSIRTDCLKNGYIRIGWPGYGNVDDFNDFDNFTAGGRWILRNYQSVMRKGDIIVSCYSATETDAIGVVTDDYEFRAEGGDYPRYRPVKWLVKNIRENIVDINQGKKFTLSTIYISNIKVTDALAIVNKYKPTIAPANKPFVFIIDEINRGELSKIFGELFGAIEASYRGIKGRVRTQYQNMVPEGDPFKEGFYVPENVYIIGTMNDIDRSVESMDFAMRRRFTWKEISWVDSFDAIFEDTSTEQKRAIFGHMSRLNEAIEQRLGRAYQIGAAYFLYLQDDDFEALWTNHLEGLLFEYFRGERDAQQKVDELHAIYNGEESDTNS